MKKLLLLFTFLFAGIAFAATPPLTAYQGGTGVNGFTSGNILFGQGTANLRVGTSTNLFWDNTNKYLGIGTSSPTATLTVQNSSGSIGQLRIVNAAAGGKVWELQSWTDGQLYINNAGGTASLSLTPAGSNIHGYGGLTLGSSYTGTTPPTNGAIIQGNVGIGTSTPSAALSVTGPDTSNGRAFAIANSSNAERFAIADNGLVTRTIDASTFWKEVQRNTSYVGFLGNGNDYFLSYDTANERVAIGNGGSAGSTLSVSNNTALGAAFSLLAAPTNGLIVQGKTGIGTSSPYADLSIHANNGDTNTTLFAIGSSTATATTTLFSVGNDGRVGIGTTTNLSVGLTVAGSNASITNILTSWPMSVVPGLNGNNSMLIGFGNGVSNNGSNVFAGGITDTSTGINLIDRDQSIRFTEQRGGTSINGTNDVNYNSNAGDIPLTITPNTLGANGSWSVENPTLTVGGQSFTVGGTSLVAQRFIKFAQPTITATTTNNSITATSSNVYINGPPIIGGSATTSLSAGLYIDSGASIGTGATNAYGLYVAPPLGATNNYAAYFGGNVGIGSTTPGFLFSTINTWITSLGEMVGYDLTNGWFGRVSPTRSFALQTGTTTSWTASTTGTAYSPYVIMPYTGILRQIYCTTDTSFLGVNVQVNGSNATPSYFIASTTVGNIVFSAGNTFTKGQKILINVGTTTTSLSSSISCTADATETQ